MAHNFSDFKTWGGLNADDSDLAINHTADGSPLPYQDYRFAKNVRNAITAAGKRGALTNVKGTYQINKYTFPYSQGIFPLGTNKCIGTYEDQRYNTVIWFVWNSEGNHGIYRFYRSNTDPDNPYGEVQQLMVYNFGWTKNTRITSVSLVYGTPQDNPNENGLNVGDLLYWCDPVPKKINITKGNICNKHKSWNIYLPQTNLFTIARFPHLTLRDYNNQIIIDAVFTFGTYASNAEMLKAWAISINTNPTLNTKIFAEACECHLKITEIGTNAFYYTCTGDFNIAFPNLFVPDNWYGSALIDRFFDRNKWQPNYPPLPEYKQDTQNIFNNVRNRVFQFRLGYKYDDLEPSCLGVWSQVPINNLMCDGTNNPSYNYIDVNFNDSDLFNATDLVILKKVEFVVREQNTGDDKNVITLDICDFLDYKDGNFYCHYKFYNDILSTAIDKNTAAQEYNDVPLESGAELFVKNRIVEGNIKTGYDFVECPTADYTVNIGETPELELFDVTFKIRVLTYSLILDTEASPGGRYFDIQTKSGNPSPPSNQYYSIGAGKYPLWPIALFPEPETSYRGGIFSDPSQAQLADQYPFFGGGMFLGGGSSTFDITPGMTNNYDQRLPEGGWPVYAAGTPYYAISKQIGVGLLTSADNSLDISSAGKIDKIGEFYNNVGTGVSPNGDIYSTVTIKVPRGIHTFRMASHWCSFGDKLGKGFMYDLSAGLQWQKTSTNTHFFSEIILDVQDNIPDGGLFVVGDIAPPYNTNPSDFWIPLNGYLYDSLGNADPNSPDFAGEPISKAVVFYDADIPSGQNTWDAAATTDHNGYFYGIASYGNEVVMRAYEINSQKLIDTSLVYTGTLTDMLNKTMKRFDFKTDYDGLVQSSLYSFVLASDNINARTKCSTFVDGIVKDQNNSPVPNAKLIFQGGGVQASKLDGTYSLLTWGDIVSVNFANFTTLNTFTDNNDRVGNIYLEANIACSPSYPNGQSFFCYISPIGDGGYNPTNPFLVPDFIIDESSNPVIKTLKRGGKYLVGYREYDYAGKLNSVVKLFEIYIPFETEDLSKFPKVIDPNTGLPYTVPTYRGGKPVVNWSLDFLPEQFAATFQFLFSKNTIYGRYLQWVANQVTYLSAVATATTPEVQTSYQNSDATAIKVSIANIVQYNATNPNNDINVATIGYTYQAGDRMRLMYNRDLQLIEGLYDFEIIGFDQSSLSIIVKAQNTPFQIQSGFVIEIYNPKTVESTDEQIYYEMAEVYNCTTPGVPGNDHIVKSGTFTCGDTYWRGRVIQVADDVTKYAAAYPVIIEASSVSDFYVSTASDIGRPGIIDTAFIQITQPTTMIACDVFLPNTAINGLSTFDPNLEPEAEIDRAYGQIQRLFFEQNNLLAVCSNKEVSNYINRQVLYQAQSNQGVVSLSGEFFGTQYIHAQNLGTDLPATCKTNSGYIFGWNNFRANFWKYQGDGEKVISDEKMITFFKQLQEDGVSDAVSVYDRYHEELITTYWRKYQVEGTVEAKTFQHVTISLSDTTGFYVGQDMVFQYLDNGVWKDYTGTVTQIILNSLVTFSSLADVTVGNPITVIYSLPETISWFEGTATDKTLGNAERWKSFFDWNYENYSSLGTELLAFENGRILIMSKVDYNNFSGVQYNSSITPVFNSQPQLMKVYNALWMKLTQANNGNNWYANTIQNIYGQLSRLKAANWLKRENNWYIPMAMDLTDTTKPLDSRILNGREMRSEALTVELENDSTEEIVMYGIKMNYTISERQSK